MLPSSRKFSTDHLLLFLWKLQISDDVCLGSELASWFQRSRIVHNRKEAIAVGNLLIQKGLIYRVSNAKVFSPRVKWVYRVLFTTRQHRSQQHAHVVINV
jgi:hypothetical protein